MFKLKVLAIGGSGSGKTYLGGGFPKVYFIDTEDAEMTTLEINPHLKKNLVGHTSLIPQSKKGTLDTFKKLKEVMPVIRRGIEEKKIESVVFDNVTFFAEDRWAYIESYEPQMTRTGETDTRAQYGALGRYLYQFMRYDLLSLPCNVLVTAHEMLESDEALDKKPDQTTPILASILGGFRDKVEGMFSCVFYLTKLKGKDGYEYWARTNKGNQRNAKSRIPLPEIIKDVSYEKIQEIIKGVVK